GLVDVVRAPGLAAAGDPPRRVLTDLGLAGEAGQLAGLGRPPQRASQDQREGSALEARPERARPPSPLLGQRRVGPTGVAPAEAPLRLAMFHEAQLGPGAAGYLRPVGRAA